MPRIVVSFLSHQRYCLRMLQLTMHSLVIGAAVNPDAHSSPRHAISPRHHALGPDGSDESYRSQRLRAKSEWRQALHRGNTSAPLQTATPRGLTAASPDLFM
jgi:hypothetical protein